MEHIFKLMKEKEKRLNQKCIFKKIIQLKENKGIFRLKIMLREFVTIQTSSEKF